MRLRLPLRHAPAAAAVAAGVLAAVPASAQQVGWEFGPGAKLTRPGFEVQVGGYVQEDFRSFHDYEDPKGLRPKLGENTVLRRLRMGLDGKWKRLSFEVDLDPRDDAEHLKNLFGELRMAKALRVRAGNFKLPVSAEWLTSSAKTDFIERNLVADSLAPGRDWGVALLGEPRKLFSYELGVFKGDGRTDRSRADTTVAGRVELSATKALDFGLSASQGDVHADANEVEDPLARGVSVRAPSGFRLYERHFVDGRRRRLGADGRFHHGPFGLRVEVLRMTEERTGQGSVFDDLSGEVARGWSASATWLVTGDRKVRTVKPERPVHHGGPGAIELGLRVDSVDIDDLGPDSGFAASGSRARNIRPVGGTTFTGGVSWWPVEFARLLGNVIVERYDDPLLAPVPGRKGNYVALLGRLQLSVP